jgi:hypothetical protein
VLRLETIYTLNLRESRQKSPENTKLYAINTLVTACSLRKSGLPAPPRARARMHTTCIRSPIGDPSFADPRLSLCPQQMTWR